MELTKKEKQRIADKKYRSSPEGKAKIKAYYQKNKDRINAAAKEYLKTEGAKIKRKANIESMRASSRKSRNSKKGKAWTEAYKPKMVEVARKYKKSTKGKLTTRAYLDSRGHVKGEFGQGSYNRTLAKRNIKEWLTQSLTVYKLKLADTDGTIFYKVGLTKNLKSRLRDIPYSAEVIQTFELDKYEAVYFEYNYLKDVNKYKPLVKFAGHTECFVL